MDLLRKAYKKACLRHHPDKNPGDDTATERFQCVGAAFKRICNDIKRREGGGRLSSDDDVDDDDEGGRGRKASTRQQHQHQRQHQRYYDDDDDDDEDFEFEAMFREHFPEGQGEEFFADMENFFENMIRETQTWDRRAYFKRRHKLKSTFSSAAAMAAAWKHELELRRQRRQEEARGRRERAAKCAAVARAAEEGRPPCE